MKIEGVEKVLAEAADRAREALEPSDGEKGPVGCAVAIFCGRQAVLGSSGAIDVASLGGPSGGTARLALEPGESLELTPGFKPPGGDPGPEKRMATLEEIAGVRMSRERHYGSRPLPDVDGLDDQARRRVAQKVLETAAELERLIKGQGSIPEQSLAAAGALERSALFGHLGVGAVGELARLAESDRFQADRLVPDTPAVHVITRGNLEARRAGHPTRLLGLGDDFGLEATVRSGQRRYELWALSETSVVTLTRESLRALAEQKPELALAVSQAIARALAKRLDEAYDGAAVKG
ncbi:MAG TPA: cyclic nucleotide-binding domain-containing protein [Myxococcales bacterium]|jgi:CRP-like cAMP-binding protein